MPIYMDKHDLDETVNAEHVAHIHQEDLKIEHEFGCKGLTYWFDDQRQTAFCLIKAPNKEALMAMHNKAHGAIPNSIIEVDPETVESFLGRIEDPDKGNNTTLNIINDPAFRVLVVSEIAFGSLENKQQNIIKENFKTYHLKRKELSDKFNGRIVQETLLSSLMSFRSVSEALTCSKELQSAFGSLGLGLNGSCLKIGLSSGLPVSTGEGIFEDTIKMAQRLCKRVNGKIVMSSEVQELNKKNRVNQINNIESLRSLHPLDEIFLNAFIDFVETSWNRNDLQVDDFSSYLGLSRSQLYRKVKSITGESLNIFLKEYRLEKALELLDGKKRSISEVAFDTGFNSPAYFSKCFCQTYGLLPSKYVDLN